MADPTYPLDTTGLATSNLITDEIHTLTELNASAYRILIPTFAPFYLDNFVLKHVDDQGAITILNEGVDYFFCLNYMAASVSIGKMLYGGISINSNLVNGLIKITYQTLGGEWTADPNYVLAVLAEKVYNPRLTVWDLVTNKPNQFPPVNHDLSMDYVYGHQDLITAVDNLSVAIANGPNPSNGFVVHLIDENNPHNVTKAQVGLANVDNTSDANKPISTATQTALDNKAAISHNHSLEEVNTLTTELNKKVNLTPFVTVDDGSNAPTVTINNALTITNSIPITIDNFLNGTNGQTIYLLSTNANTTIANNVNIKTLSGADTVLNADVIYKFIYNGTKWYEF